MKTKLLIGLLLISVILVAGCSGFDRDIYKACIAYHAEKFCEERSCEVQSIHHNFLAESSWFYIFTGEFREKKYIDFTKEELEECKELARRKE